MTIRARERAEMTALYRLIVALALSLILWLQLPTPLDDLLGSALVGTDATGAESLGVDDRSFEGYEGDIKGVASHWRHRR